MNRDFSLSVPCISLSEAQQAWKKEESRGTKTKIINLSAFPQKPFLHFHNALSFFPTTFFLSFVSYNTRHSVPQNLYIKRCIIITNENHLHLFYIHPVQLRSTINVFIIIMIQIKLIMVFKKFSLRLLLPSLSQFILPLLLTSLFFLCYTTKVFSAFFLLITNHFHLNSPVVILVICLSELSKYLICFNNGRKNLLEERRFLGAVFYT